MPKPNSRVEPFVGYRVALATEADTSSLLRLAPPDPTVHALLAGQRSITLTPRVVIEREPELHLRLGAKPGGSAA